MLSEIDLTVASTEKGTYHSESEFQNITHLKHHFDSGDIGSNIIISAGRRVRENDAAKNDYLEKEDMGSLFSRLKCKSHASSDSFDNSGCDNHDGFGKPFKANSSKGVHKISTPWLVATKKKGNATKSGNRDNQKGFGDNKKSGFEDVSNQDSHITTGDANIAEKEEPKRPLRSILFGLRRNISVANNDVPASGPNVFPTRKDESSSQNLAKGDRYDIDSSERQVVEPMVPVANQKTSDDEYGDTNYNTTPKSKNHNNESSPYCSGENLNSITNTRGSRPSTTGLLRSTKPSKNRRTNSNDISKHSVKPSSPLTNPMVCKKDPSLEDQNLEKLNEKNDRGAVKCPDTKITGEHRRRYSPPRLRAQVECSQPKALRKRNVHSERRLTADKELLMGLEIQKDLDRMALKCGKIGWETNRLSSSRNERKPPQEHGTRLSILPSSMSCFNPTSQLDGYENTEGSREQVDRSPRRCYRGASSALFLDVNDDDTFWKYYDDLKPMHRSSIMEGKRGEKEARELKGTENFTIDERREPCDGHRFDELGRTITGGITKDRDSNNTKIFTYANQPRYGEERDTILKSSTPVPFQPEHHNAQNQAIDEDPTNRRQYFSSCRNISLRRSNAKDKGLERDGTSTFSEKEIESKFRYESLMNYPTQSRCDLEESLPNKEELLDQMRHAVQKAAAELDSLESKKAKDLNSEDQYRAMTMETEFSDESSYVSSYDELERNQLLQSNLEERRENVLAYNESAVTHGVKRDKYDLS